MKIQIYKCEVQPDVYWFSVEDDLFEARDVYGIEEENEGECLGACVRWYPYEVPTSAYPLPFADWPEHVFTALMERLEARWAYERSA